MSQGIPDSSLVYETYHGRVRAWIAKLVGGDEADDLTQEVFIKVSRSLDTLEDPAKLSSWIFAIASNTVRDSLRRRSRVPELVADPQTTKAQDAAVLPSLPDGNARSPEQNAFFLRFRACLEADPEWTDGEFHAWDTPFPQPPSWSTKAG